MKQIAIASLLLMSLSHAAPAHNVLAGAYAEGLTIEGEVGFSSGDMAKAGVIVEVFDEDGNALGTTETKEDGVFSFQASDAKTHVFKADLGFGHIASVTLDAEELVVEPVTNKSPTVSLISPEKESSVAIEKGFSSEELQSLIRSAVAQQIRPLQKDIQAYKEKVFLRDIAGGIGFIFGLFGVAAWMASRRKETSA